MNPSTKQVVRMLAMVPYLRTNQGIPVADLAREFNIRPAQAQRELRLLMLTGAGEFHGELIDFDLTALEDDGVVHIRDADFMPRPLRVTRNEAMALIVALQSLRQAATPEQAEFIDSVLVKLSEAAGTDLDAVVDVRPPTNVDPDVQVAVARALAGGCQLELVYTNEARDEQTSRVVDPHRSFDSGGHRYLTAWCHRAEDDRLFRLDRIVAAAVLEAPVTRTQSARALSDDLFRQGPDTPSAIVDLAPEARWLTREYRMDVLDENADGSLRALLHGSDLAWLRRVVLRAGGRMTVVEPAELAEQVQVAARAALAAYDGGESD